MERQTTSPKVKDWVSFSTTTEDGRSIGAYLRKGTGPYFVYIPGTWSDSVSAASLLTLLNSELSLVAVNMPGRINSSPVFDYSIVKLARDVLHLIDSLQISQFFISGHSLGAMTSIEFLNVCPERITGVIPIEGWTHYAVQREVFGKDNSTPSTTEAAQWLVLDNARCEQEWLGAWTSEERKNFGSIWRNWNGYSALENTTTPVLEIWGDRGKPHPNKDKLRIPDRPGIEIAWIHNTTHSVWVEAAEEVATTINSFIIQCSNTKGRE